MPWEGTKVRDDMLGKSQPETLDESVYEYLETCLKVYVKLTDLTCRCVL